MTLVEPIPHLAYGFGRGKAPETERPGVAETIEASMFYNPVIAGIEYLQRDTFEPEADFNPVEYGKKNELWNDHYTKLGVAKSSKEFDAIAGRIREEQLNRSVLDAAGGWGLTAEIISGSLSPTMAIPLVGQAKGLKGVAQVLAYAGAAASVDEVALLATRETYTGEEAALGIAAGTVLGGALGGAAKYMGARARARAEADLMAPSKGMGSLQDKGAIHYTVGKGSATEEAELFPKPSKMSPAERDALDADELKLLEDIETGKIELVDGRLEVKPPRTDDASLSAAGRGPAQYIDSPNVTSRVLNKYLGKLNPITRGATQSWSPAARRFTLQASDAGLRGDANADFIPHASEGTIEARTREYESFTGQFTQELDDAFSRYIKGDQLPDTELQGAVGARFQSMLKQTPGKMSQEEFNNEVFMVAQTGAQASDPNIAKAAKAWHKFAKNFVDYAEEAHEFRRMEGDTVGPLFDPEGNLGPDAVNFVSHVFSDTKIEQDPVGFLDMLTNNAEAVSRASFTKDYAKFDKRRAKLQKRAEILNMTPAQSRQGYTDLQERIEAVVTSDEYVAYDRERLRLQREIREEKAGTPSGEYNPRVEELQDELKALRESTDDLQTMLKEVADLKAEQRLYNQSLGRFEDARADLIQKAEKLEEQDLNALERVLNAGGRLSRALDKVSDRTLDKQLGAMWKALAKSMKSVELQDTRIQNLYGKKKEMSADEKFQAYQKSMVFSERRARADAKASEVMAKIEGAEKLDRQGQRDLLRAVQDLNNVRIRDLNARRALREDKLLSQAAELTEESIEELRVRAGAELEELEENFDAKWRERGAEDLDLNEGSASFSSHARETAEELAEKIKGMNNPIAGLEILGGKRGPELARVLNIPLEVKAKYLETDLERVARIYAKKMAPDIELYRATGSVNASKVFRDMREDFRRLRTRVSESDIRPKNRGEYQDWIDGKPVDLNAIETIPYPEDQKAKAVNRLLKAQKDTETDLNVIVTRLRDQRGVTSNPDGIMFRMGRAAKDLNVARYMGSVVPSSIPDVGRPVMKFGFNKVLRNGWGQYAKGMERVKLTRAESRRIGVAWDPVMHNRVQQFMDIADDYGQRKTMGERGIGFVANKTGLVAGFDRWTAEMKQFSAAVVIGELSEGLAVAVGGKASKKADWYKRFLAEHGLDEQMARRIWDQHLLEGGSEVFEDGFRLPNTEGWTDVRAKRAYRAAVNRAVDSIIVTPGLDMPNWADENMAFSMLAQFKSFTFASTNRVVLSGAQQADMALVQGMAFSLALGTVSYYLWANSIGGSALEEANKFDPGQWADEAISRSGLLGIFAEPYEIAQRIPATQDLVTFANQRTTRRRATGLLGSALGPSYDLGEKVANIAVGLDDPTQSTLHQARLIGPWQNVFWLRRAIDAVEDTASGILQLPERRSE